MNILKAALYLVEAMVYVLLFLVFFPLIIFRDYLNTWGQSLIKRLLAVREKIMSVGDGG